MVQGLLTSCIAFRPDFTDCATARAGKRRRDFLHKESARIAKEYGGSSSSAMSVRRNWPRPARQRACFDARWAGLTHMLSYKAVMRGGLGLCE